MLIDYLLNSQVNGQLDRKQRIYLHKLFGERLLTNIQKATSRKFNKRKDQCKSLRYQGRTVLKMACIMRLLPPCDFQREIFNFVPMPSSKLLIILHGFTAIHQLTISITLDSFQVLDSLHPSLYQCSFPKL